MSRIQEISTVLMGGFMIATTLVTALYYEMALNNLYIVAASSKPYELLFV